MAEGVAIELESPRTEQERPSENGKKESPYLDAYLEERRDKLAAEEKYKFDINDVGYFFDARGRDIANHPTETDARQKFRELANAVLNARSGESMTPQEQKDIIAYLTDFYKKWDSAEVATARKDGQTKIPEDEIKNNLHIYESLILAVKEQPTAERTGTQNKQNEQELASQTAELNESIIRKQEKLPEYSYKPGEKTEEFFKETEDKRVTMDTVKDFVSAQRDDLVERANAFETEHAPLIAAVDRAEEFFQNWVELYDTDEKGRMIAVVEKNGKIVEANWEDKIKDTDGKVYRFDPHKTLGNYIHQRRAYTDRIEGTENAEGINNAIARLDELTSNSRTRMPELELLPIFQAIDRQDEYLQEGLRQLGRRFDGAEIDQLESLLSGDPDALNQFKTLVHRREILQELTNQVSKRKQGEKGKLFSNIKKMRPFRKGKSEE